MKIEDVMDCTDPAISEKWHANNCDVCKLCDDKTCPHLREPYKKNEPLICPDRVKIRNEASL